MDEDKVTAVVKKKTGQETVDAIFVEFFGMTNMMCPGCREAISFKRDKINCRKCGRKFRPLVCEVTEVQE